MPQQVTLDDDVFRALQERAVPLVDTPSSVIRRVLGLAEEPVDQQQVGDAWRPQPQAPLHEEYRQSGGKRRKVRPRASGKTKSSRAPKGVLLAESEYEIPILQILIELGGRAPTSELLDALESKLDGMLKPIDRERLASGEIRWKNRAQFVRLKLVRAGEMVKDSPRGTWEISEQGRRRVEAET
jgi:hypothetical protein